MDNLSHTLLGAHLSRLPAFRKISPSLAFWTAVAASNVPDVDGLLRFVSERAHLFEHRGITHSLAGLLAIAPLVALAAAAIARRPLRTHFLPLLALAAAGVAGHILLDVLTSWGTMILLPFSHARVSLPWLFILDVVVWAILGIPLLRTAWRKRRGGIPVRVVRRSSQAALAVFSVYVALCGVARERSRAVALRQFGGDGQPVEVLAWPSPPGPLIWTTAVRTEDQVWHRGFASVVSGGLTRIGELPTGLEDPRVQVALETELGSTYAWFADALYLVDVTSLRADGSYELILGDLRFSGPFWEEVPFQLRMEIGPDFQVRDWDFRTGRLSPDTATPAPSEVTAGGRT